MSRIKFNDDNSVFYFEGRICSREFGEFKTEQGQKLTYCRISVSNGLKDFNATCSVDSPVASYPLFEPAGFGFAISLQNPANGRPSVKYKVTEVIPFDKPIK